MDEMIKQLKQLSNEAKEAMRDASRVSSSYRDECDDFSDGYSEGVENTLEYLENFNDELERILKRHEIELTMMKKVEIAPNQLPLKM